jgi:pimeloyl-ACP methyl ester carboxylesterase
MGEPFAGKKINVEFCWVQDLWWHIDGWQWHGLQWGRGSRILICFHGFGEEASRFQVLEDALGDDFTIVAIDLPFHGGTRLNASADADCLPVNWHLLMQLILQQFHQQHCALLGYSLGGRICLQLVQEIPQQIHLLILLAPDGLHHNFWFYFLTRTYIGKKLFRWHVDHPHVFFGITRCLEKMRWLSPSFKKFLDGQMNTRSKRMQVWLTWNSLRAFVSDLAQVKKNIQRYAIPCYLLFGKYDRVIKPGYGKTFCKPLAQAHMFILDCGHQLLTAETALFIKQQLDLHS